MESIFLIILLVFGAVTFWQRLRGKKPNVSTNEEAFGVLIFLLLSGCILFMFILWALAQFFPVLKHDKILAVLVMLILGYFYLKGLFILNDWVIGKDDENKTNT